MKFINLLAATSMACFSAIACAEDFVLTRPIDARSSTWSEATMPDASQMQGASDSYKDSKSPSDGGPFVGKTDSSWGSPSSAFDAFGSGRSEKWQYGDRSSHRKVRPDGHDRHDRHDGDWTYSEFEAAKFLQTTGQSEFYGFPWLFTHSGNPIATSSVPEPRTALLLLSGLCYMVGIAAKQRKLRSRS